MGETVTFQIHTSHYQTLPLCLIDGHGVAHLNGKFQTFELKMVVRWDQRNWEDEDIFSLTDACENRGFDDMFVQKPGAIAQFQRV